MSTFIKYFKKFSSENDNIIVFVSKLSQLKSLNLPINLQNLLDNKAIVSRIKKNKYIELFENHLDLNISLNIKILIIDQNDKYVNCGAFIYDKIDYELVKNVTFCFSKDLFLNYSDVYSLFEA